MQRLEESMIAKELEQELASCKNLPSPPGIAKQVIELASEPDVHLEDVASVLSKDPAIATKILRIANSSMYARQRKTENVRQALLLLGLDATISLALSFSLLQSSQKGIAESGLDHSLFWRRSLLAATASQALCKVLSIGESEGLFLTSLIQDIGILALERARPDFYSGLGAGQVHENTLIDHERSCIGADHAVIGGWLLARWNFPERIQRAVERSHTPESVPANEEDAQFSYCVTLSSRVAEVFLEDAEDHRFVQLAETAQHYLNIDKTQLNDLFTTIGDLIPEAEAVFETDIVSHTSTVAILDDAREALMVRNLKALSAVSALREESALLERRTRKLEESSRRDSLTGLYNREYLDEFFNRAFRAAMEEKTQLSIAFADLDRFKSVNDNYGHAVGDRILQKTAEILLANVRETDVVSRYGGEEFVIVFPDTDAQQVSAIAERIVRELQAVPFDVGSADDLFVTISLGVATHGKKQVFLNPSLLIKAADKALYAAKLQGRNRSIVFDMAMARQTGLLSREAERSY